MYPTYGNGFYNGLCYYNGMPPHHRQTRLKRRKRFLSARNSHPSRSTETTTDYSDDDVGNSTTYSNRRHHNGWMYHHNNHYNYNQYHYNSKYHKMNVDKNVSLLQDFHRVYTRDLIRDYFRSSLLKSVHTLKYAAHLILSILIIVHVFRLMRQHRIQT